MSEINGIGGSATQTPAGGPAAAGTLGKDAFLELLTAQLRYQNPLNPVSDMDFIGQMAQFTSLEQLTNVAEAMERLSFASQVTESVSLIGRTVDWELADGTTGSGVVQGVSLSDGVIRLRVGDTEINPADVRRVE